MSEKSEKCNEHLFYKKAILKNFGIFTGKHLCWSLFFNKTAGLQSCNFIKKGPPTQMFACEYCAIFKNTCFEEHLWTDIWAFSYMIKKHSKQHRKWRRDFFKNNNNNNIKINSARWKKSCFFMMLFIISPIYIRRHLLYIIKSDSSERL